jgi:hypothetical protein
MTCCTYKCTNGENCPVRRLEQYKTTRIDFAGPEPEQESFPEPELTLSIAFTLGVCAGMLAFYAIIVFR